MKSSTQSSDYLMDCLIIELICRVVDTSVELVYSLVGEVFGLLWIFVVDSTGWFLRRFHASWIHRWIG